jgi:hypothetical protein
MARLQIGPIVSPSLPISTLEYSQQYQDQFANVLRLYFNKIDNFTISVLVPNYGTTANRPTQSLAIGQTYFDTSLGIPIWYNGTNWVNSAGTTV